MTTMLDTPVVQHMDEPSDTATEQERARSLPTPTGYRILCAVPDVDRQFENSRLIKSDTFIKMEEHGTTVWFVLTLGPEAYKDTSKFPQGPWCKEGDFVLVRTYSGTRFKVFGKEFRLLNDDQIDAVVQDPRGITRA